VKTMPESATLGPEERWHEDHSAEFGVDSEDLRETLMLASSRAGLPHQPLVPSILHE